MNNKPVHRLWGAEQDTWTAFKKLVPIDIRPVVCNPNIPTLRSAKTGVPQKQGKLWSKSPSRKYDFNGQQCVSGFRGWPSYKATASDIDTWRNDPDMGFGIVADNIKAIDIDVDDAVMAERIDDWFCSYFNADLPYRHRENSPRKMLIYRLANKEVGRTKVVVPIKMPDDSKAQVEFLFDKNFFVAGGRHHTGAMQSWDGLPDKYEDLPVLDNDKLQDMINAFAGEFSPDDASIATQAGQSLTVSHRTASQVDIMDDLYQHVTASPYFKGTSPDGAVYVRCPWEHTHSNQGGKPDETMFFPKGLGGRDAPGFKCMHTTHGPKTVQDFIQAIGYVPEDFPDAPEDTREALVLSEMNPKTGVAPATMSNIVKALQWLNGHEFSIRYDKFEDNIYVRSDDRKWKRFTDEHYVDATLKLYHLCHLNDPNQTKLRQAFSAVAKLNQIDTGLIWLEGLKWDGKDRTEQLVDAMSAEKNPYTLACARYLLSAMAARLACPFPDGVQVDMSLILASRQGEYKTSFLKALAPKDDWYTTIDLSVRDADTARTIKGKAIVELAELRGMMGRDAASLRAWMTATYDEYVQKYKEATARIPRRCIFVGTTNHKKFLVDPTGNRRWLPINVAGFCSTNRKLDIAWVKDNKEQLWAQGYAMFKQHGVAWQEAQTLARVEHHKFRIHSMNERHVLRYLQQTQAQRFTTLDVIEACGIKVNYPQEIEAYLLSLGWEEQDGIWTTELY